MKKLVTIVFAMLLTAGLSFAQATSGSTGAQDQKTSTTDTGKKGTKSGKKAHKGGKKSKKGQGTDNGTTTPPK